MVFHYHHHFQPFSSFSSRLSSPFIFYRLLNLPLMTPVSLKEVFLSFSFSLSCFFLSFFSPNYLQNHCLIRSVSPSLSFCWGKPILSSHSLQVLPGIIPLNLISVLSDHFLDSIPSWATKILLLLLCLGIRYLALLCFNCFFFSVYCRYGAASCSDHTHAISLSFSSADYAISHNPLDSSCPFFSINDHPPGIGPCALV